MKKVNIIFILILFVFFLSSCKDNTSVRMITLDDAFSITPYINIYGSEKDIDKYKFDRIILSYYNERDKKKSYVLKQGLDGWSVGGKQPDKDWQIVN